MTKTIMITGASSGFGKDAARLFREKGWNVVATMRNPPEGDIQMDVTDKASIEKAVQETIKQFGRIDVLVNNAGYGAIGALEAASAAAIHRQFDVNVFGVIDVTRAVLPHMRRQKKGVIINISSMGGIITIPFGTLYHATKFAIEGLTEALRYELQPFNIQTKLIEPGSYRTSFNGPSMDFFGAGDIKDYQEAFDKFAKAAKTPGRGNPNVNEVSEAIYRAATDGTGQLRYLVGADAENLVKAKSEGDYQKTIAGHFGLWNTSI